MRSDAVARPLKDETQSGSEIATGTDAMLRSQVLALAAALERRIEAAHADQLPDADAPGSLLKEYLDQKRQELQTHLTLSEELSGQLASLQALESPAPDEVRVRVLLAKGSIYDFTRLGRASQREQLDRALSQAKQILATHGQVAVVFGEPEVIEKGTQTWELIPDDLWRLCDDYATEGLPALLFADRLLLPDKTIPHSWGHADRDIAFVAEDEWLSEGKGLITAHNLIHLLGLDDGEQAGHLTSHDAIDERLNPDQVERLRERAAERAAQWVKEHAAVIEQGQRILDQAQPAITLLEQQGDTLWERYQASMEKVKATPPYGVRPPGETTSDLAYQVERLSQQIARAERDIQSAKEALAEVRARLRVTATENLTEDQDEG